MPESSSGASGDLCRLERAKINNKKHQMSPGDTATPSGYRQPLRTGCPVLGIINQWPEPAGGQQDRWGWNVCVKRSWEEKAGGGDVAVVFPCQKREVQRRQKKGSS